MCVCARVCVWGGGCGVETCQREKKVRRHNTLTQLNVACHHIAHGRLSGTLLEPASSGKCKNKGASPEG